MFERKRKKKSETPTGVYENWPRLENSHLRRRSYNYVRNMKNHI